MSFCATPVALGGLISVFRRDCPESVLMLGIASVYKAAAVGCLGASHVHNAGEADLHRLTTRPLLHDPPLHAAFRVCT